MTKKQLKILKKISYYFIGLDPEKIVQCNGNTYVEDSKHCGSCVGWHIAKLFCRPRFKKGYLDKAFFDYQDGVKFISKNFNNSFHNLLSKFAFDTENNIIIEAKPWFCGQNWLIAPSDVFMNLYEFYKGE